MKFRDGTMDAEIWHSVVCGNEYGINTTNDPRCPWAGSVVDIGGHIGAFSWFAAHTLNARKIVVVEPDQESFAVLQENLAPLIADGRVIALNFGIGPPGTKVQLQQDMGKNTGGRAYAPIANDGIPAVTLDELFELVPGDILLKLDCEGCEYDAIKYSKKFTERVKCVVGEYHEKREINGISRGTQKILADFFAAQQYVYGSHATDHDLGLFGAHK